MSLESKERSDNKNSPRIVSPIKQTKEGKNRKFKKQKKSFLRYSFFPDSASFSVFQNRRKEGREEKRIHIKPNVP